MAGQLHLGVTKATGQAQAAGARMEALIQTGEQLVRTLQMEPPRGKRPPRPQTEKGPSKNSYRGQKSVEKVVKPLLSAHSQLEQRLDALEAILGQGASNGP